MIAIKVTLSQKTARAPYSQIKNIEGRDQSKNVKQTQPKLSG